MAKKVTEDLPSSEFEVKNVVATAHVDIKDRLDLAQIAKTLELEYDPDRFPGIVMRVEEPKATLLIFSTAKMVITGLRRTQDAQGAVEAAIEKLKKVRDLPSAEVKIVNLVASGSLNVQINLNMGTLVLENAMYEPEVFPGLIYRMKDPKAVFLIFFSGKFVCTGIRDKKTIREAVSKLTKEIVEKDLVHVTKSWKEHEDITWRSILELK